MGHCDAALVRAVPFVQCPRDVLFAYPCLSSNQDRPGQACESVDLGHHREHRARLDDGLRRRFAAAPDHAELGSADPDYGARPKLVPANAEAIDPGAVGAAEVADRHAS
jgi:hypothetical protein